MAFTKTFEQSEYDASDKPARQALLKLMPRFPGLYLKDGKQKGVDSIIYRKSDNKIMVYLELERKKNWEDRAFHFPDVQFLEKKEHYGPELNNLVYWVLFNDKFTRHLTVDFADICDPSKCWPEKRWSKVAAAAGRPGGLDDFIIIPKKYMTEKGLPPILKFYEDLK